MKLFRPEVCVLLFVCRVFLRVVGYVWFLSGTYFEIQKEAKDLLFISTERYKFCVLGYENGEIVTHANGDVQGKGRVV